MPAMKSAFLRHALTSFGLCLLLIVPSLARAQAQAFTAADRAEIAGFTLNADVLQRLQAVTRDGKAMRAKQRALDMSRVHLIETRFLVRRKQGWAAIPYVWNEQQTEARLARTGAVLPLTLVADKASADVPTREKASRSSINFPIRLASWEIVAM